MITAIAAVLILSGVAFVMLVLRRPRERVVQVVETYSQMLRRKGGDDGAPDRPLATAAMSAAGTVPGQHPMPAAAAARAVAPTHGGGVATSSGWALSGFDSDGKAVRISVANETLARAARGLVIGRQESLSDLVLDDNTVSRRHARVVELNGGVGIVDLNSSNGTAINGQLLAPYKDPIPLNTGAKIEFGDVKLTFSWT
jgi:hypothetical protein